MKSCIYFVEKNIHGAWVVYGLLGVKQYYDDDVTEFRIGLVYQ